MELLHHQSLSLKHAAYIKILLYKFGMVAVKHDQISTDHIH